MPSELTVLFALAGGDLHYHLSQHGVFSESEMRFYAAEIILGLEHMHNRFVVYRDLKVTTCPHIHTPTDTLLLHGLPEAQGIPSLTQESHPTLWKASC